MAQLRLSIEIPMLPYLSNVMYVVLVSGLRQQFRISLYLCTEKTEPPEDVHLTCPGYFSLEEMTHFLEFFSSFIKKV